VRRARRQPLCAFSIPRVSPGTAVGVALPAPRHPLRRGDVSPRRRRRRSRRARRSSRASSLTGNGGFTSAALSALFRPESAFYSVAAGLTQPIFDGWLLEARLEQAQGRQIESLTLYRRAVVSGFTDVERALIAMQDSAERERLQQQVVDARGAPLISRRPGCVKAPWTSSPC
jgi:hypothetical protein